MGLDIERVKELFELCLKVNGNEGRKSNVTGDKPTVMFEYRGHINAVFIRVYAHGWKEYADKDREIAIYNWYDAERFDRKISDIMNYLRSLIYDADD